MHVFPPGLGRCAWHSAEGFSLPVEVGALASQSPQEAHVQSRAPEPRRGNTIGTVDTKN